MSNVIKLIRLTPASPHDEGPDILVTVGSITSAELLNTIPAAPEGVFIVEVERRDGSYWSHNLKLEDTRPDIKLSEGTAP